MTENKFNVVPSTEEGFDLDTCFKPATNLKAEDNPDLDYYFRSYSNVGIHEEMLSDAIRTNAYKNSIIRNQHLFKDKIVLDIGCGTGILSFFAAQAGAKHVYAIDLATIAENARKHALENNLENVTVIRGKVEELSLPVEKVDIIISEWMGYFLIYESMLDTVLFARDKWLKEGGMLFPDKAVMYIAGFEDEPFIEERVNYWDKVYGIKMTSMKECVLRDACVEYLNKDAVNTNAQKILEIDLETCTVEDLDFASGFKLDFYRRDLFSGYVVWWNCFFSHGHRSIELSTSSFLVIYRPF